MENNSQELIVVNKDYFQLDYPGQKYTKSIKYKDWIKEYKSSHQGRLFFTVILKNLTVQDVRNVVKM